MNKEPVLAVLLNFYQLLTNTDRSLLGMKTGNKAFAITCLDLNTSGIFISYPLVPFIGVGDALLLSPPLRGTMVKTADLAGMN